MCSKHTGEAKRSNISLFIFCIILSTVTFAAAFGQVPNAHNIVGVQHPLMSLDQWNILKAPADSSGSGTFIIGQAGERVERGDLLRVHSVGKFYRADADSEITMPGAYISMDAGVADAYVRLLTTGIFRYDSRYTFTTGGIVYGSTSTGLMSTTAPSATGDQVQIVGIALSADIIDFRPDFTLVQVP